MREKVKSKKPAARGNPAPIESEGAPSVQTNSSSVDSWRKLRFRNDSVDGAGAETTFGPAAGAVRRRPRPGADLTASGTAADYFSSEH